MCLIVRLKGETLKQRQINVRQKYRVNKMSDTYLFLK